MPHFPLVSSRRSSLTTRIMQLCLALVFVSGGGTDGAKEARAQAPDSLCLDTLAAAEEAYRNRNYEQAVALASQCTDRALPDEVAIRTYRTITLASLRQGALIQARSAVENILQIDPNYTADPVNDPPSYDLFVSMVRQGTDVGGERNVAEDEPPDENTTETAEAAPAPSDPSGAAGAFLFKPFGIGFSDYTGDMPAQTASHPFDLQEFRRGSGFPFLLHGELGYQVAPRWGLLVGMQVGNYPIVGYNTGSGSISDSWRYTPQLLVRYTFAPLGEAVTMYLDGGGNVTFGGEGGAKMGYGPSLGGGVDIPVGSSLSFYIESRFNVTFPDDAIDVATGGAGVGGTLDSVNQLLGVGLRLRLGGS